MFRFGLLLIFVAAVFAEDFKAENGVTSDIKIGGARTLTDFLRGNPKLEITREFKAGPTPKAVIVYKLGNRINGDRLVANASARQQWSSPQDVQFTLSYPRTGTGAVITYVEIRVDQSSSIPGKAYVVSGGLNQRQITINVEAYSTLYFQHTSQIFGY